MLNKKLVEILGWLQQADEMLERCQEDTSRTRTPKSSMVNKEIMLTTERIKEEVRILRLRLNEVAELFVALEGMAGATVNAYTKELDWPLSRLIYALSKPSTNGRRK
jgi:hypothetical protein